MTQSALDIFTATIPAKMKANADSASAGRNDTRNSNSFSASIYSPNSTKVFPKLLW